MDSLDLKYAKSILLRLAGTEKVKKSDLFDIVKSHQVLDNLLDALAKDRYITIEENERGPKKYSISLTLKGIAVAKQLKKADEIASGAAIPKELVTVEISEGTYKQITKILKVEGANVSLEDFVRDSVREKIERWKSERGHGSSSLLGED